MMIRNNEIDTDYVMQVAASAVQGAWLAGWLAGRVLTQIGALRPYGFYLGLMHPG